MSVSAESTEKFIYPVFQKAFKDQGSLRAADYGHWTTENYTLDGDDRSAIAYSIPLILDDGTVYGVLGVEIFRCPMKNCRIKAPVPTCWHIRSLH